MSQLDVSDLTRIAQEAATAHHLPVEIVGAMLAGSESDRIEILVNVDGCVIDPCLFSVAVFRNSSRKDLLDEIGAGLRDHLESHRRTHPQAG